MLRWTIFSTCLIINRQVNGADGRQENREEPRALWPSRWGKGTTTVQVEPATFQGSNICVKLWVLAIKMKSPVLENSMLFTIEAAVLDRLGVFFLLMNRAAVRK